MDLELADKSFIISGGSKGLGLGAARSLINEGANVFLTSRSEVDLVAACTSLGPRSRFLVADIAQRASAEKAVEACRLAFGGVNGAVISTGGPPPGTVMTTSDHLWRAAFESVFLGPIRLARMVAETADPSAALVLTLSLSSVQIIKGLSISNGLRPGLAMLVTDLAIELGAQGTRVVGILPGRIDTDRIADFDRATGDAAAARTAFEAHIPLGRYGTTSEFGDLAAFCLSARASYLTGSVIKLDGGLSIAP